MPSYLAIFLRFHSQSSVNISTGRRANILVISLYLDLERSQFKLPNQLRYYPMEAIKHKNTNSRRIIEL